MTFRNIDRRRFEYLLLLGTMDGELRDFFVQCRRALIQHGGKVQNLPHGQKARIRCLAVELPNTTDEVVREWFSQHLDMIDPVEPFRVVEEFRNYEEVHEDLPEVDARRYARSCLVHLFRPSPPDSLIDFLRTPIGGQPEARSREIKPVVDEPQASPLPLSHFKDLPRAIVSLLEGSDTDEFIEGLPTELTSFLTGLQAAGRGQYEETGHAIDSLPADSAIRACLAEFVERHRSNRPGVKGAARGLHVQDREEFDGKYDLENDEVLGYCTNASISSVFVRPLAVVRGGQLQFLTDEARRLQFPDSGDLIAFEGGARPRQPRRGEIGVWQVDEHPTSRPTHFHLKSESRTVYEVHEIPFSATDYDPVREYLKDQGVRAVRSSLQPLLFLLKDGLIVGGRADRPDLSKEETFESGLYSWDSLSGVRVEGRVFVLGPLPNQQRVYECVPLATAARKIFKSHAAAGNAPSGLTKAQLRELSQSLDPARTRLDEARIRRIRAELEQLAEENEAFEVLVSELMRQPQVEEKINQLIQMEAAQQGQKKTALQAEIARLQTERGEWDVRIQKLEVQHRELRAETARVIRSAFDKARVQGVAMLGDLAVFQALAPASSAPSTGGAEPLSTASPWMARPLIRELDQGDKDVIAMLKGLGVPSQHAAALSGAAASAMRAGLMVCVKGVAARLAVERWARAIGCRAVLVDATVGLLETAPLSSILAVNPSHDVVAVLDANLSALDIYARPILDLVLARVSQPQTVRVPSILLALAEGVGSLPLPKTFVSVSVSLDLDAPYVLHSSSDLEELMSRATDLDEGTLYARLWRPGVERLREEIEKLDPEEQALVLSILVAR